MTNNLTQLLWTTCLALLVAACAGEAPAAPQAPVATVEDTETLPPLYGTGVITFGTAYDPDTLAITSPKTSFKTSSHKIAWSASLSRPVGALSVTFVVASRRASGSETVLIREEVDSSSPDNDTFANAIDLALLLNRKAGTYVMRYVREGDVLAEGTFTLVK